MLSRALQAWPTEKRENLAGAALVVPREADRLLPMGMRVLSNSGTALPVLDDTVYAAARTATGLPIAESTPLSREIQSTIAALLAASLERTRDAQRDQNWARPPRLAQSPQEAADHLRRQYAAELQAHQAGIDDVTGLAVSMLLELADAVDAEDGTEGGFAAAIASIDPARLEETSNAYAELVDSVVMLGLYAPVSEP